MHVRRYITVHKTSKSKGISLEMRSPLLFTALLWGCSNKACYSAPLKDICACVHRCPFLSSWGRILLTLMNENDTCWCCIVQISVSNFCAARSAVPFFSFIFATCSIRDFFVLLRHFHNCPPVCTLLGGWPARGWTAAAVPLPPPIPELLSYRQGGEEECSQPVHAGLNNVCFSGVSFFSRSNLLRTY